MVLYLFIPFLLLFESIPSIRVFCVRSRYLVPFVIVLITLCTMTVFVWGDDQSVFLASIRTCYRYQSCKYGEPMVFAGCQKNQKSEGLGARDGFFGSIGGLVWIEVDIVRLHIHN